MDIFGMNPLTYTVVLSVVFLQILILLTWALKIWREEI